MAAEIVALTVAVSPASDAKPTKPMGKVIHIERTLAQAHSAKVVRSSVEETLNAMLDAEVDRLCRAQRYEHGLARCRRLLKLCATPARTYFFAASTARRQAAALQPLTDSLLIPTPLRFGLRPDLGFLT